MDDPIGEHARKLERDAMRLWQCKDCKHFQRSIFCIYYSEPAKCNRPKRFQNDVVYGRVSVGANVACVRERRVSILDNVFGTPRCGITAQFFESKWEKSVDHLEGQT